MNRNRHSDKLIRVRKVDHDASPGVKALHLSRKQMDSSCHRLSRLPNKFSTEKTTLSSERSEPFIERYMSEHPEAIDKRTPEEKLKEIEEKLQSEEIESKQRFELLIRQKALRGLVVGDQSSEMMNSYIQIGEYYKDEGKPDSAIRNFNKAAELEKSVNPRDHEKLLIHVNLSEAYLSKRNELLNAKDENSISAAKKSNTSAISAIKPVKEFQDEDIKLIYRRDHILATTEFNQNRYLSAISKYETALNSYYDSQTDDEIEEASLLYEAATCGNYALLNSSDEIENEEEIKHKVIDWYKKAQAIYQNHDHTEEVEEIDSILKLLLDEEEEIGEEEEFERNEENEENYENSVSKEEETELEEESQPEIPKQSLSQTQNPQAISKKSDENSNAISKEETKPLSKTIQPKNITSIMNSFAKVSPNKSDEPTKQNQETKEEEEISNHENFEKEKEEEANESNEKSSPEKASDEGFDDFEQPETNNEETPNSVKETGSDMDDFLSQAQQNPSNINDSDDDGFDDFEDN